MKKDKVIFISILGVALILVVLLLVFIYKEVSTPLSPKKEYDTDESDFSINFIKESNKNIDENNYMISPYSVEVALSMLRDGVSSDTYDEMVKVVPKRNIKDLRIKEKINIANGLFVSERYENSVRNDYITNLKSNYYAEVLYDEFKTPDVINKWVKKETDGMIDKLLDDVDPNFVLAIVNAVSMDEEWESMFDGEATYKESFKINDKKKMDVFMMHKSFEGGASFYENDAMKSVVLPYKKYDSNGKETNDGEQLEFIGILPNDDIDTFVDGLTLDMISEIDDKKKLSSNDYMINLAIPKFKFDYNFKEFGKTLIDMGIKKVFSPGADFSKMMVNDGDYMINKAIHKSHVEFDEEGTKAAAVTGFTLKDNAMAIDVECENIKFNKPFVFLIKDVNSSEILFFGVVKEPTKYKES